jgi:hypothetical protein
MCTLIEGECAGTGRDFWDEVPKKMKSLRSVRAQLEEGSRVVVYERKNSGHAGAQSVCCMPLDNREQVKIAVEVVTDSEHCSVLYGQKLRRMVVRLVCIFKPRR